MKKLYYSILAISMTIISFVCSPIHSYAAGSYVNTSVNVGTDFKGVASTNSYMALVNQEEYADQNFCLFDCSVDIRNQRVADSSDYSYMYCSGYILWLVTLNFTMNTGLTGSWRLSYDISLDETASGVYACVPLVNTSSNQVQIYFYTYMENAGFANTASVLSAAHVNLHITAWEPVGAGNVSPGITVNSLTMTSQGASAVLTQDPSWAVGQSYVRMREMLEAIELGLGDDIASIVAYLRSINTLFPQYMDNVLSVLSQQNVKLGNILQMLLTIEGDTSSIYTLLREYIEAKQTEASEVAEEATQIQEQMSEVAESLEVEQPSIDGALDQLDDILDYSGNQGDLFYWLQGNGNILVTILIFTFALALTGYILYGRM